VAKIDQQICLLRGELAGVFDRVDGIDILVAPNCFDPGEP
jgi:hypothetical protein